MSCWGLAVADTLLDVLCGGYAAALNNTTCTHTEASTAGDKQMLRHLPTAIAAWDLHLTASTEQTQQNTQDNKQ
jgi:hypothetical protein